jgi:hypothetical protein
MEPHNHRHRHHLRPPTVSPDRGLARNLLQVRAQEVNERGNPDHTRGLLSKLTVLKESDCMFSGPGSSSAPVHIMTNPNRGRGAAPLNGHGPTPSASKPNGTTWRPAPATSAEDQDSDSPQGRAGGYQQDYRKPPMPARGGYNMRSRGRGYSGPGRGGNRGGGHRGRGRGMAAPLSS